MFGNKPVIISSRVMDYTYGIALWRIYDEKIHPVEKKVYQYGKLIVYNLFKIFVRANEELQVESKVTHFITLTSEHTNITIFSTKDRDMAFTTDPGCEQPGRVIIDCDINIPLQEHETKITFTFGDTELHVFCENVKTGKVETLILDLSK
ncbi:hypothetical protein DPMN_144321 [Dreissena polymorpha]|uniref:Uncharacterized protein n=1 Tax=Dreissena polymorpha TaxID=45954 RepID=A0A9D4GIP8_DREPO|nr:hypothetical protein DPMN_144321 [Dreissena polymorpha]